MRNVSRHFLRLLLASLVALAAYAIQLRLFGYRVAEDEYGLRWWHSQPDAAFFVIVPVAVLYLLLFKALNRLTPSFSAVATWAGLMGLYVGALEEPFDLLTKLDRALPYPPPNQSWSFPIYLLGITELLVIAAFVPAFLALAVSLINRALRASSGPKSTTAA